MSLERLLSSIKVFSESECWVWQKSTNSAGYGQLMVNKRYWLAHRYSYYLHFGSIESSVLVRHLCHNCRCVNPSHLCAGSNKDNYWDSRSVHLNSALSRRKKWIINGVVYETCREAQSATGISYNSLIKHTVNEVFDVETYRSNCEKSGVLPKI